MVLTSRFLIISILFICFLGCTHTMKESIHLSFSLNNDVNLDDLSVNLYLYKRNSGSKWYGLVKKETILDHGKLIKSQDNYSDISYYEIYIFTPNAVKVGLTDNIFKNNLMDYHYSFSKNFMNFKIHKNNELFNTGVISYQKDLKESKISKFIFYDAKKEKFELTHLGPDTLDYLDSMTFKELMETDKILSKDILKLKKISFAQKKQLIEIHNMKKF